ncbi:MAG: hypothetical protein WAU89_09475 [Candidatus Acidiferrales bacterium]
MAILALLTVSSVASAQNPDTSKWMCRNLADSGGFTYQGETIFGAQACRPIQQASTQAQPATPTPTPVVSTQAQTTSAPVPQTDAPSQQQPAQNAPTTSRQLPRVFLQSASHGNTWNARRDQSMEMSKDFEKECPGVRVTVNQQMADYTVLLNHIEVGLFARDNQMQVADKNGDLLQTKEGGGIKGGVKKVCELIVADWTKQ